MSGAAEKEDRVDKRNGRTRESKDSKLLTSCFHHGTSSANKMKMHQMCVEMIAVMVQYQYSMENGAPLFES